MSPVMLLPCLKPAVIFSTPLQGLLLLPCLFVLLFGIDGGLGMTAGQVKDLRQEAERMFYHGYDNYMKHAFPEDEIRPISCTPLTRDRANPAHIELNDALGNYSLTLIDSLSTLAILASPSSTTSGKNKALSYFQNGIASLVEQYGDGTSGGAGQGKRARGFDVDSKVQVFETVIRGVGGLLSAHLFAVGELPIKGYTPKWSNWGILTHSVKGIRWSNGFVYNGQLLRLADDLARRLLPAFHTTTGLPYPRVNLRYGTPFYVNSPLNWDAEKGQCKPTEHPPGELTETCSAGAGSLVLEFTTLSRLTGDPLFEQLAKRAFWSVWGRKSSIGLVGSGIDAETGQWMSPYTGIGAGIDSFYEYAAKASVLLSGSPLPDEVGSAPLNGPTKTAPRTLVSEEHQAAEAFGKVWQDSQASIKRHLYRGEMNMHPHYVQGDLYTGAGRAFWLDSLSAFYPGVLATMGHLEEAISTHLLFTALWTRYSAIPERWSTTSGGIESGLGWWGGRPEFIESTYHLFQATHDPWYLHVGEMTLRDIKRRCWAKCGWAGTQDVRSGDRSDRMESFFLGETTKYLFLLFDPDHTLNKLDAPFVFSTEGHPLIIPRHKGKPANQPTQSPTALPVKGPSLVTSPEVLDQQTCPRQPAMVPFSISATAARADIFHAANLARLHLMPTPDTLESPLVEYSSDHPSISISDVRSPSNYTYFPWTLPSELVPYNGICSKIIRKQTFDITFPASPNTLLTPGFIQRVSNGILINSIGGVRLGLIKDVETPPDDDVSIDSDQYRVQAINNILLGKDERVFLAKSIASNVVNPLDPNFTRICDPFMLDLVIDIRPEAGEQSKQRQQEFHHTNNTSSTNPFKVKLDTLSALPPPAASPLKQAFSSLLQHVASLITDPPSENHNHPLRSYIPATLPTGPGSAPLPDIEEALGPDLKGHPQGGPLLWPTIYTADENCDRKLPASVPREHQVIVMKRGGCSFNAKLQNIPTFAPSKTSLQLVVFVSFEEGEAGEGVLIRPLLGEAQLMRSGLVRHHPIPMVMVSGGERTWEIFERAVGMGIKRRYEMQAQGVPIRNLIIL